MNNTAISNPSEQNSDRKPIVWFILIGAVLGCCCLLIGGFLFARFELGPLASEYFPTSTPTPNLTATAQTIQTRTMGIVDQWPVVLTEPFDNNHYDWYVGTYSDDYTKSTYEIKDGKYRWQVDTQQGTIDWVEISPRQFVNFYATVEIQGKGNSLNWDYGMVFRQSDEAGFYYFGITPNRGFFVSIIHKQQWKTLIPFQVSPLIKADGPNRLAVLAQGSHFVFLINDQFVAETDNDQIKKGKLALGVQLYNANDQAAYEFDNVEIRKPAPPPTVTATRNPNAIQLPTLALTQTPSPTPTP